MSLSESPAVWSFRISAGLQVLGERVTLTVKSAMSRSLSLNSALV